VQADTIVPSPADPQSFNRYSYVRNNPLLYRDPSGHKPILDEDENDNPIFVHPISLLPLLHNNSDPCDALEREIKRARDVLAKRAYEIVENPLDLPMYGPQMTVESHQIKFREWQARERRLLQEWITNGCGDEGGGGGLPADAWAWAAKPLPFPTTPPSRERWTDLSPQLSPNTAPVPSVSRAPSFHIDWGSVLRGATTIVGIGIIAFDILTIPSGEGAIGAALIGW
jgi:hypothetical protein